MEEDISISAEQNLNIVLPSNDVETPVTTERVLKSGLVNMMIDGDHKDIVLEQIRNRVVIASQAYHRLSLAVNLYVREYLENQPIIENIYIPRFLSTKSRSTAFAFQMMLGIKKSRDIYEDVDNFLDEYKDELPPDPIRFKGDTNTYSRASALYITNYKNFLTTTFDSNQKRFCSLWCERNDIPSNEAYILRRKINGWACDANPEWLNNSKVMQLVQYHRDRVLQLATDEQVSKNWMENNYEQIIIYYHLLSRYFKRWGKKEISVAPLAQIKNMFIHIDSNVFYGILKSLKLIECNFDDFTRERESYWRLIFDVDKNLTVEQRTKYVFTGTIQTDGCAVCVHYRKPDPAKSELKLVKREDDRIIGIDPGRVTLLYAVEKLDNGKCKNYKLSKKQYYNDSGITEANKKKDKWNLKIKTILEDLSQHSKSARDFYIFREYLDCLMKHYTVLWDHYTQQKWARQRFALYSGKKSVYDKFFTRIKRGGNGRRSIIAYGDAGFASTARNETSAPTSRSLKECMKHFIVVKIDEFRTTQIDSVEDTQLFPVKEEGSKYAIRGLLWCNSTTSKFVNRDKNAALNMIRCYYARPAILVRTNTTRLPSLRAKIINRSRAGTPPGELVTMAHCIARLFE